MSKTRPPVDSARLEQFLTEIGRRMHRPIRLVWAADDPLAADEFERLIPVLKNELQINLEPASPADFLPVPSDTLARSPYMRSYSHLAVYHYDLPATVLSKIARGSEQDLADVEALVRSGAVAWADVETGWTEMRTSPRGWLRHTPEEVERRMRTARERLGEPPRL